MENAYLFTATGNTVLLLWVLIALLFILSFIGIVVPIIPGVLLLWIGFLVYHFFINAHDLSLFFWITVGLFTFVLLGADFYLNLYFVEQFGGSKWSKWGALIGMFLGIFIYPPFGILLVPLIIVFIIEVSLQNSFKKGSLAALGTLAGFLSGAVAKVMLQVVMIIIFFIFIII
ncbi:MAG TPA: DUF456 family protein [Pseudogracilibacillus sp.]|nr:DUF456 family protein [Pseudogracilibacillus sp.]